MMKVSVKNFIASMLTIVFSLINNLYLLAQNVADSDLNNTAGTNKNFRAEWWLFGVIGLVVLVFLLAYGKKRRRSADNREL